MEAHALELLHLAIWGLGVLCVSLFGLMGWVIQIVLGRIQKLEGDAPAMWRALDNNAQILTERIDSGKDLIDDEIGELRALIADIEARGIRTEERCALLMRATGTRDGD